MKKSIKLASEIISEIEKSGLTYDEMLEVVEKTKQKLLIIELQNEKEN